MLLRKGKVEDKFLFNIAVMAMPTITKKSVKSLGRFFNCFLRDTKSILSTCIELDFWLKVVNKSGSTWKFKTQV